MDVSNFYFACPVCVYDDPAKECTFFVRNGDGHPVRMATSMDFRAVLWSGEGDSNGISGVSDGHPVRSAAGQRNSNGISGVSHEKDVEMMDASDEIVEIVDVD